MGTMLLLLLLLLQGLLSVLGERVCMCALFKQCPFQLPMPYRINMAAQLHSIKITIVQYI